jgi:hypothetical protein
MIKPGDLVKIRLPRKVQHLYPDIHNYLGIVIKHGNRGGSLDVWWVQLSNGKFRGFEESSLQLLDDKSHDFTLSETVEIESLKESSQKHPPGYKAPQGSERDKKLDQTQQDLKRAKQLRKDGKTKQADELEQKAYRRRDRMEKEEREKSGFKNKPRSDTKSKSVNETVFEDYLQLESLAALIEELIFEELSKKTKETLRKKAKERGFTPSSVEAEYKKGLAAWASSGSRPGMTQHQWAMARVNSATPSKKWATVKKSKTKK